MNFEKAIEYIVTRLKAELPAKLKYHSADHTLSVMDASEILGKRHNLDSEHMSLLLTAAAYHDSGFLRSYQNHEMHSCDIADEFLPNFGFDSTQIAIVKGMIMATKIPQQPQNLLERIICDADLLYLGEDDYDSISDTLREEMVLNGMDLSKERWLAMQISFLESHDYWTDYAMTKLSPQKEIVLENLKSR